MSVGRKSWGMVAVGLFLLTIVSTATAKYSGGTGEPNDPYQIATAEDLILLGETPDDYGKHFILTADIDLDPNLPGGKVFDRAVIAPDVNDANWWFDGTGFTGVFDGNDHTISHLTIRGETGLGLFGSIGSRAKVTDLGVVHVNVTGSGNFVGGLLGETSGTVTKCYSAGVVIGGGGSVGGLVGYNDGTVINCYSASRVTGKDCVGGLAGCHGRFDWGGTVTNCHSTGAVEGDECVGGLVGCNSWGSVERCYSIGAVSGTQNVGGLVGGNEGGVCYCYSTGTVSGGDSVGGLVGNNLEDVFQCYSNGVVDGNDYVGGLVGKNFSGHVGRCASASTVHGNRYVGGLVGKNGWQEGLLGTVGSVSNCYSTGEANGTKYVGGLIGYQSTGYVIWCYSSCMVQGTDDVGGLVGCMGYDEWGGVSDCFWDTQTSGQTQSAGGAGKTTGEMQTASTFLEAGWDFVDETANGTEDIWWILEGKDYPRLWWEQIPEN